MAKMKMRTADCCDPEPKARLRKADRDRLTLAAYLYSLQKQDKEHPTNSILRDAGFRTGKEYARVRYNIGETCYYRYLSIVELFLDLSGFSFESFRLNEYHAHTIFYKALYPRGFIEGSPDYPDFTISQLVIMYQLRHNEDAFLDLCLLIKRGKVKPTITGNDLRSLVYKLLDNYEQDAPVTLPSRREFIAALKQFCTDKTLNEPEKKLCEGFLAFVKWKKELLRR